MSFINFRRLSVVVTLLVVIGLMAIVPGVFAQSANTVELVGSIEAMSVSTITVNQQRIDVSTAEINVPLEVGTVVKVEGSLDQDGTIVARQINAVTAGIQPGEAELVGTVESLNGTTLVVNGQTIDVSAAQIPANLAVGQMVKVHATATGANTWMAREVELFQPDTVATPVAGEFEIVGSLESIGSGTVVVSGQTISIVGAEVKDALLIGTLVKVHVSVVNGQLTAREIENATTDDNANSNENLNDNSDDNANLNNNENENLNGNDNTTASTAVSAQQAIDIVLAVYPTTTIRSIELTTKFDGILVWEVKIGSGIELNIDAQSGAILTIDRRGDDDSSNGNNNANGNSNDNHDDDNGNLNENGNDNSDDNGNDNNDGHDNSNDNNDDHGGDSNDNGDGDSGMGSDD